MTAKEKCDIISAIVQMLYDMEVDKSYLQAIIDVIDTVVHKESEEETNNELLF